MAFSEDAKRLLRDNLKSTWAKVATGITVALAWLGPYKAAEYLGVECRSYKLLAALGFYVIAGITTLIVFLSKSLHQAYEKLGPGIPTQKALTELASKL